MASDVVGNVCESDFDAAPARVGEAGTTPVAAAFTPFFGLVVDEFVGGGGLFAGWEAESNVEADGALEEELVWRWS